MIRAAFFRQVRAGAGSVAFGLAVVAIFTLAAVGWSRVVGVTVEAKLEAALERMRQSIPDGRAELERLEAEGYFDRCRAGDQRACSLFTRLAAFRLNPRADRGSFGWLTKSAGETQVDGYAEDAIVYGADPAWLNNVIDLVGGAGAPGASIAWQAGRPRRPANLWEAPRALTAAELEYVRPGGGSGGGGGGGGGGTDREVLERIERLEQTVSALRSLLEAWGPVLEDARAKAGAAAASGERLEIKLEELAGRQPGAVEWPEYSGAIGLPGFLGGQRTIVLRPRPVQP